MLGVRGRLVVRVLARLPWRAPVWVLGVLTRLARRSTLGMVRWSLPSSSRCLGILDHAPIVALFHMLDE